MLEVDPGDQAEPLRAIELAPASHSHPPGLVRCECRGCGSHVHAIVLKQTISGRCSTCGSWEIVSLGD